MPFGGILLRDTVNRRNALADELDPIDARILDILQADARTTLAEIGRRIHMSQPAVTEHDVERGLNQRAEREREHRKHQ